MTPTIDYKYKGLPLQPSAIERLIVELANGQTREREDLVKAVEHYHTSNGGLPPKAQDFPRSVQKALTNLQKKGFATNAMHGFWKIHQYNVPVPTEEIAEESEVVSILPIHKTYGEGQFSVYLYYFPTYKSYAEMQGNERWPCKIGRTDRDPSIRILSQSATAFPEHPTVEFVIKTDVPGVLEKLIHAMLRMRNQHKADAPGSEWFETNPEEVLDIVRYSMKGTKNDF